MFPIHTLESAPEGSRKVLEDTKAAFGMVPNLYGALAGSPAAVTAYADLSKAFGESDLSPAEQQVLTITVSVENGCAYCVAAHSTMSVGQKLFDEGTLESLRAGEPLDDDRLEALRRFVSGVVQERGWVSEPDVEAFLSAGFARRHVLDVLTGVAMKTLSNYTNHLVETPLDEAFQGQRWAAPAAV